MATKNGVTLHKRSAVPGKVPLTTDLELGQLGINTNDGKLYIKKDDGAESVVEVSEDKVSKAGDTMSGNLNMGEDAAVVFSDATHVVGAIGTSNDYSFNQERNELVVIADDLNQTGEDPLGLRMAGAYTVLESEQIAVGVPGSEQGSRLVSAGLTQQGETILAWEPPPVPGYEETVSDNTDVFIGTGSAPTVWVAIAPAMVLSQDVAANAGVFYYRTLLQNTTTRTGTIGLGVGVNGGTPSVTGATGFLGQNQQAILAGTIRSPDAYTNGDSLIMYARIDTSSNNQFSATTKGTIDPTTLSIEVAGEGGGSGIASVQDDSNPTLGGSLNVNDFSIVPGSSGNVEIEGNANFYGQGKSGGGAFAAFNVDPDNPGGSAGFGFFKSSGSLGADMNYFEDSRFRIRVTSDFLLETFNNNFDIDTNGNGAVRIGNIGSNEYAMPLSRGGDNQIMVSDANGILTWQDQSGGGSGGFNSPATENLDMNDFEISNIGGLVYSPQNSFPGTSIIKQFNTSDSGDGRIFRIKGDEIFNTQTTGLELDWNNNDANPTAVLAGMYAIIPSGNNISVHNFSGGLEYTAWNSANVTFGTQGGGDIYFNPSPGGVVTFYGAYNFPETDGGNGQFLTTDGGGNLSWSSSTLSVQTVGRPTAPEVGESTFDTDIGLPIWWNGTDWINAMGSVV